MALKYNIDDVKNECKKYNWEIIETEYKGIKNPLHIICNIHPEYGQQKTNFKNIKRHCGCKGCTKDLLRKKVKYSNEYLKRTTEEKGFEFIGIKYINGNRNIQFVCSNHKNKGIQIMTPGHMIRNKGKCQYCCGYKRTTDEFKSIVKKINPNITILSEYVDSRTKVLCKCNIDGYKWYSIPSNMLHGKSKCPICHRKDIGNLTRNNGEDVIREIYRINNEIEILDEYYSLKEKLKCRCKICNNIWYANSINLLHGKSCPVCKSSKGERTIRMILEKWGIKYECQKKFNDCIDMFPLPFDFYLPLDNVVIEYDGEFHYRPFDNSEKSNSVFLKTIKHDKIKNKYCNDNKINLIRIPYWDFENIEYILFDNFVHYNVLEEINIA